MSAIFYYEPARIGNILLNTLKRLEAVQTCRCPELRKPTLLQEKT